MNTHYIERMIVERIVDDALAAGLAINVYDGEDYPLMLSTDKAAIMAACFSTDEDTLFFRRMTDKLAGQGDDGQPKYFFEKAGWVRLIYGNGYDVISDYSGKAEATLAGANALAEEIANAA